MLPRDDSGQALTVELHNPDGGLARDIVPMRHYIIPTPDTSSHEPHPDSPLGRWHAKRRAEGRYWLSVETARLLPPAWLPEDQARYHGIDRPATVTHDRRLPKYETPLHAQAYVWIENNGPSDCVSVSKGIGASVKVTRDAVRRLRMRGAVVMVGKSGGAALYEATR